MAAGFKSATVNSSLVPSTQTNFPAYVDLSRLGITTLAEAQSVRVYADSGKTTEWAREIVSATEMHVKVPSLTSTVTMYVDWDGVRSDYTVTGTYGRNAVWSDYNYVFHLESDGTNSTGDTGATLTSITHNTTAGRFGTNGASFDGTASKLVAAAYSYTSVGYALQAWVYRNNSSAVHSVASKDNGTTRVNTSYANSGSNNFDWFMWNSSGGITTAATFTLAPTTWAKVSYVFNGGSYVRVLKDGSQVFNFSTTDTPSTTSFGVWWGADQFGGGRWFWPGYMDEIRGRIGSISNDWETTEYNNQSNESSFWGTWSTVSSYKFVPQIRPFVGL